MQLRTVVEASKLLNSIYSGIVAEEFIQTDPIQVPRRFTEKRDIEIASFFACILAWGQRTTIIKNTNKLMHFMGEEPFAFICNHKPHELRPFEKFVHRTFNATDCLYFIDALQRIYLQHGSLEGLFKGITVKDKLSNFHQSFFDVEYAPKRSYKHIANPMRNSSAKRLNMFLRWMVRKDRLGIDFGIWNSIDMADLMCPLDIHVRRAAVELNLLSRKQQDWKAVEELSANLRKLDAGDPVKYDLPLFILGQRL